MMTSTQRQAVFDGIPNVLDGVTCTKVLGRQYILENSEVLPSITVTYLTEATRARWKGQEIRSIRNEDTWDFDCTEGLIEKATIGLTVSSMDYSQTLDMASDLITQLYQNRLDMTWWDHRVKFIDVLNAPIIDSYRYEQGRGLVFRAHLDIWIEYEVSWPVVAPSIKSMDADIQVGNIAVNDLKSVGELILYAPGLYGMYVTLDNHGLRGYSMDALLDKVGKTKLYGMSVKIAYEGIETNTTCDMGLTLE